MSKKRIGSAKSLAPVVAAMNVAASTSPEDAALSELLSSISPESTSVETIEPDGPAESDIEAAVETIENQEHYAGQPSEAEVKAAKIAEAKAKKEADAKAAKEKAAADRAEAKAKKEADKAIAKAQREQQRADAKAAKAAAKAALPPKQPRVKFENKTDLMKFRLGDKLGDFMVLETADAMLEGDALKAKQDETLATIDGMSQKVKNRANFLMTYMLNGGKLNNVVEIAFRTLKKDGQITTGDKGNFHEALVARPYSVLAARAMGNNTISMLKTLKVLVGEKGTYTGNPDSLILAKVNGQLGL